MRLDEPGETEGTALEIAYGPPFVTHGNTALAEILLPIPNAGSSLTSHGVGNDDRVWWSGAGGVMQLWDDPGGDFVEAVVELRSPARTSVLTDWCAARELTCSPMVEAVLVSGSRARFESAFGQAVPDRRRSTRLATPPELRDVVESVIVLPIPQLHGDQVNSRG